MATPKTAAETAMAVKRILSDVGGVGFVFLKKGGGFRRGGW